MTKRVQIVRHTSTALADAFTGLVGELSVDMEKDELRVHDGSLAGGHPTLRADWTNMPASVDMAGSKIANFESTGIHDDATGTKLTVGDATTTLSTNQTLQSTDAGATEGPSLGLLRDSASPAANDFMGAVGFSGKDSLGNITGYAKILSRIIDPTDGAEEARLQFMTTENGAITNRVFIQKGMYSNGSGGDQGVDTINFSGYYIDGVDLFARTNTWTGGSNFSGENIVNFIWVDDTPNQGPVVDLVRNSASPAAFDNLAVFRFLGKHSGGGDNEYAGIRAQIIDPTDTAEDGRLNLRTSVGGSVSTRASVQQGFWLAGATGEDQGSGTVNAVNYYINGENLFSRTNTWTGSQNFVLPAAGDFTLALDDDGASSGPYIKTFRNSTSPAANDLIGQHRFQGKDSAGNTTTYATVLAQIIDPTDGSEDSALIFSTLINAVSTTELTLKGGIRVGPAAGGYFGAGTINAIDYYIQGVNISIPSETAPALIEIATQAEVDAGTDTVRAVTPATLANSGSVSGRFLGATTLEATGTYIKPSGVNFLEAYITGGGGGGADASSSSNRGGGGGGGGGTALSLVDVSDRNFVPGDVNTATEYITLPTPTGSGVQNLKNDTKVQVSSNGTLPAPLVAATDYWIVGVTGNTIQLATTKGGAAINLTSQGTGIHTITVISIDYTIGAGGAGGTSSAGVDGGDTNFGAATGGYGQGGGGEKGYSSDRGGAGGIGSGGVMNFAGTGGGSSGPNVAQHYRSGNGGSSFFGGGAEGSIGIGRAAQNYGGGGSGGTFTNQDGGAGSAGVIFIKEYS